MGPLVSGLGASSLDVIIADAPKGQTMRRDKEQTQCQVTMVTSLFTAGKTSHGTAMTTNGYRARFLHIDFEYTVNA